MAPLTRLQVKTMVAALIVFAVMGAAALLLYAPRLGLLACAAPSVKQLYRGPPPRSLTIDAELATVQVRGDPRATEASVVLHYCSGCVSWNIKRSSDALMVQLRDTCRAHVGLGSRAVLQITIPGSQALRSLNISIHVGRIELRDVDASSLNLEANVGDIEASNVSVAQRLSVETNVASVYLSNVFLPASAAAELRTNVGSMRLLLATSGASVDVVSGSRVGSVDNTCPWRPGPRVVVDTRVGSVWIACRASR